MRVRHYEPPECWCGWRARRSLVLRDEAGNAVFVLPVCDAHPHGEDMPGELKLRVGLELDLIGVSSVSDGNGLWRLYAAGGSVVH